MEGFYALKLKEIWTHFKREHFSFWMICAYLFVEYVRPQSIVTSLDILPWAQVFLLLTFIGLLLRKERRWVSDPANVWMALFLIVIILSSVTAEYPHVSWAHFMDFFGWFVIYFLIINIVNTEKRYLIFLAIFIIASFKLSFFGARIWAMRGFAFTNWGIMGPPGFFQNSGELSIQMLMFSPIAYQLAMFLRPHITRLKFFVLISIPLTGALTVLGASSRGAQLGMVYQFYHAVLKGRLTVKVVLLVAVLAGIGYSLLPDEQKVRFSSAGEDRTSQQRLLYWKHGMEMFKEHPLLGVGYYNFAPYYEAHYPDDVLFGVAQLPHNIFVQVGTDAGLLGLFVFLMILYRGFKSTREIRATTATHAGNKKPFIPLSKGLDTALWGFIIAGQFVTVTYYPFLWINLALTVALRNIIRKEFAPPNRARNKR